MDGLQPARRYSYPVSDPIPLSQDLATRRRNSCPLVPFRKQSEECLTPMRTPSIDRNRSDSLILFEPPIYTGTTRQLERINQGKIINFVCVDETGNQPQQDEKTDLDDTDVPEEKDDIDNEPDTGVITVYSRNEVESTIQLDRIQRDPDLPQQSRSWKAACTCISAVVTFFAFAGLLLRKY
jgi:hypothetical protein